MNRGFTLIEVMISMIIMVVVGGLSFVATRTSMSSMAVSQAKERAQAEARDVVTAIAHELEMAPKTPGPSDPPLPTGVNPVVITAGPTPAITFQIPRDGTRTNWSRPITYGFVNEDINNNYRTDPGEDVNLDGILNRRIVRIEDRNRNGSTTDPGEVVTAAGTNNISACAFAQNGNIVTVTVTARAPISGTRRIRGSVDAVNSISSTVTSRVQLLN